MIIKEYTLGKSYCKTYTYTRADPLHSGAPLVIAMDPSKSGFGLIIGRINGKAELILELSGTGMDTTVYCKELKYLLKELTSLNKIHCLGYEPTILPKKGKGQSYITNVVLNEVQSAIKDFAYDRINKDSIIPANNSSWKSAILPSNFNKKGTKGSLQFVSSLFPNMYDLTDNITDVICIFWYLLSHYVKDDSVIFPNSVESCDIASASLVIVDDSYIKSSYRRFTYNCTLSFKDNLSFVINRCSKECYCIIDDNFPIKKIYDIKQPDNLSLNNKYYLLIN